jgi:hypothetical protein
MLTSDSARIWMRVTAAPLASKVASSSRSMIVSVPQSWPGVPVASGRPLSATRLVKALEPLQKKPAGMGFWAKS